MKDSSEQSGAHESLSAGLNEQLLRRLTEPAGLIDVRYAQQKYERFAEWFDKRLALLHQLQTRYADNSTDDNQPLLLTRPFGEAINLYSTTVQSTAEQSVMPAVREQAFARSEIAETFSHSQTNQLSSEEITTARATARPVAHSSPLPEGEFRVSRRRAPFNPSPVQDTSTPAQLPLADGRPARSKRVIIEQDVSEPGVSERDASRGAQKSHEQSGDDDSGSTNQQAAAREIVQTAPSDTSSGSSLPLTKLPAAPDTSERLEKATPPRDQSTAADDAKPAEPSAGADSSSASRQATAGEVAQRATTNVASSSSLPLAKPQPGAPLTEHQAASPSIERREASTTKRESVAERESAVATEITEGSFTQTKSEIVWRKSSGGSSEANPISSGQVGNLTSEMPQVDSSSNALRSEPTGQHSAPAQSQRREIEIEQLSPQVIRAISEKVMRAISLDLAIELERRGLKKWR